MRAYQLAVLAAAFFEITLAAPAPAAQHNYVSKYPQHPVNQGYGDNYPKYWQNEAYNPADYPPVQQRVPFYPYPYSNAWKSTSPAPQSPEEVEVKVIEAPKYVPPHSFPSSKSPAREAINAYSSARGTEKTAVEGQPIREPRTGRSKAISTHGEPVVSKEQERGTTSKNLKFNSDDNDGTSYTKVVNNPQKATTREDDNTPSDWSRFSYGVVKNTLAHDTPREEETRIYNGDRKTNAMGKIQKLIGSDNVSADWHDHIKRGLDSGLEKRENGWPDHIQAKADRMMKSAASMQGRGQLMIENDQQNQAKKALVNQAPAPPAAPAAPSPEQRKAAPAPAAPAAGQKKALPGKGYKNAPPQKVAPAQPKKDSDPMMRNELPKSQNSKQPKKASQSAPAPQQKPARGNKEKKSQSNSPQQSRQPRLNTLKKRDAAPVADAEAFKGKNAPSKGTSNNAPPKGTSNNKGKGGKASPERANQGSKAPSGRAHPSINQDRPKNKKNGEKNKGQSKGKRVSMENDIREHFEEQYVDEVIYEECEVEEEETGENHLQKRQQTNRRVLPCGPPVTVRRILGAGEALPTPGPVAYQQPAIHHHQPVVYQQPAVHHHQNVVAAQVPQHHAAYQDVDGQVQVLVHAPAQVAAVPAYAPAVPAHVAAVPAHVAAVPAHVAAVPVQQEAHIQIPVPQVFVTRTIERNIPGPTQYITVERPVQVQVPGPTQVVERPVVRTVVQPYEVQVTQQVNVPYPVTQQVNVPYPVTQVQKIPYPVTQTQQVQVTQQVNVPYAVTQQVNVPYPVTKIQNVPYAVTQVQNVPYAVTQVQNVPYPVVQTQTQIQRVVETVFPQINAVAREREIIQQKEVLGQKEVVTNVPVTKLVPVTSTRVVCSACGQEESGCGCNTPFEHSDNYAGPAANFHDIPRTARDIEAFFRAQLPDEFAAAQQ